MHIFPNFWINIILLLRYYAEDKKSTLFRFTEGFSMCYNPTDIKFLLNFYESDRGKKWKTSEEKTK